MSTRFQLPLSDVGNGIEPSDGATLDFFISGTSTRKDTFSDEDLSVPNANPVVSDSDGLFGDIWIDSGSRYKVVLKDKNAVQKWEADPVVGGAELFDVFDVLVPADIGVTVQGFDVDTAKLDVGQSFTAAQTFKEITETQFSVSGVAPSLDPANGTLQYWTLIGNSTPTKSLVDGQAITLMINDGAAYTITWPTITWVGGSAPTLPTSGFAVLELWQINGVLYGAHVGDA